MNRTTLKVLPAAITLALACGSAFAGAGIDEDGFHGYFRVGAGTSTSGSHGPQSCYGLGGNTMKYRLGNECDAYFEGGYTKEIAKSDGVSYVATIWADAYSPKSDFGDAKLSLAKAYVEAKGLDFLNGGTAWIGKRYYFRPDIHMLDLQYINMNGTGAGLDQVKAGPGKFSYAFFKDNDATTTDALGNVTTTAATRQNFIYQDIPVNTNGTIDVAATIITAQGDDKLGGVKHNGWQMSAFHKQDKVFGGANTFGVQYGVGPGTGIGVGNDRIGAAGSTLLGSDVTRLRVFDDMWVQPTTNFGMEMVALVQKDKSDAGGSSTWTSLGVRPVYALNKNFKLVMELGTDRVTSPTGGAAQRLTKLTFAPTISAGPGLWSRPELRAFITYGKWNDAATAAINANNNSGPVYNNGTSGTSFGFQVESWF
ncbi:maltoporin [Oxalobacteraceae bacterium GrIS 1.11]